MKYILTYLFLIVGPAMTIAQSNYTVISNTNVVDVNTGKIMKATSILIKEGLIQDVLPAKKMKLPAGAVVIDGSGRYVIPGMTDAHIHFSQSGGLYTRPDAFDFTSVIPYEKERENTFNNASDFLKRYLRMGITTVADVGGPFSNFTIRDSVGKEDIFPTILVTGPLFSMVEDKPLDNGDPPIIKTTTIAEADALFDRLIPLRPDYIKIWYIVTPELPAEKTFPIVQHIAKRTHEAKLKLAVHATELRTAELALDAGVDILVHSVDDEIVSDGFIKKLLAKKVSYIPTLIVYSGYSSTMSGKLRNNANDLRFANPFVFSSLSDVEHLAEKNIPERIRMFRSLKNYSLNTREDTIMAVNLKKIYDAGVNVVAGTDAGNVGTMHASSFLAELEAMKHAGLSNVDVLKTATLNSAQCFGQNTGLISKGRKADLVILANNPLEDLDHLNSSEYVIKSGNVLKADAVINESPEMLIQRQLIAYNARDIDAFLDTYADNVELYDFPDTLVVSGKEKMRSIYDGFFKTATNLHCQIVDRIVLSNTIIDHERVKFNDKVLEAVAIYEVKDGKIIKVTFKY
jgi:imidazolonepropionase-like amidohydrolase